MELKTVGKSTEMEVEPGTSYKLTSAIPLMLK